MNINKETRAILDQVFVTTYSYKCEIDFQKSSKKIGDNKIIRWGRLSKHEQSKREKKMV